MLFKGIQKFWKASEFVATTLGVEDWAELSRSMEERENLIRARDEFIKMGI